MKANEKPTRMTSVRLDPELVAILKRRGDSLGVGWQTVMKMVLNRYANSEL